MSQTFGYTNPIAIPVATQEQGDGGSMVTVDPEGTGLTGVTLGALADSAVV